MTAATPAAMPAGHIVKLRSRGQSWTSPCLAPAVAEHQAGMLRREIDLVGGGQGFVEFECGDGRHVEVRARDIYAVEHGPVERAETGRRPAYVPSFDITVVGELSPEAIADALVTP